MKTLLVGLTLAGLAYSAAAVDKWELDDRIKKLAAKFEEMQQKPDKRIPPETLRKAHGIILFDRTKAGFIFAYQGGSGVTMVKDSKTGKWSPAAFLTATEASLGFQIGAQQSFIVMLLMNTNATKALTESTIEFGGEARGTAGNSTAGAEGTVSTSDHPVLVYIERQGLYGGAAVKGGAISPDPDANRAYYGEVLSMQDILFDKKVKPTEAASEIARKITVFSGESKDTKVSKR
jgi:lipid-binding SYLF domain-containing protein